MLNSFAIRTGLVLNFNRHASRKVDGEYSALRWRSSESYSCKDHDYVNYRTCMTEGEPQVIIPYYSLFLLVAPASSRLWKPLGWNWRASPDAFKLQPVYSEGKQQTECGALFRHLEKCEDVKLYWYLYWMTCSEVSTCKGCTVAQNCCIMSRQPVFT